MSILVTHIDLSLHLASVLVDVATWFLREFVHIVDEAGLVRRPDSRLSLIVLLQWIMSIRPRTRRPAVFADGVANFAADFI